MNKPILSVVFWIAVTMVGALALLGGGSWTLAHILSTGMSETKDLVHVESPDHLYVATGYHIFGGATVSNMTIVVVHEKGQSFTDKTNGPVLVADNIKPFRISWAQNRSLVINCSLDNARSKKQLWKDVTVKYVDIQ